MITVDRKVVEVAGHLYVEAPRNRKYRKTIYPRDTPVGYYVGSTAGVLDRAPTAPE